MPHVIGGKKSTYLLINGLTVPRPVQLSGGLDLLPIDKAAFPRPYLSNLSLLDQQFALITLPWVQCQLRVTGHGGRDVATRAWNALWDVLLLSAIYAAPVDCGLQSPCAMERFTKRNRLNIVHYRFFEPADGDGVALTDTDCQWLEANFVAAQSLLTDHRFQNAVHCLATYRWHSLPRAQLALLWAGVEGLFSVDAEIAFRVSLYSAKFLAPANLDEQREIFNTVKRLYGIRSKAVHGGKMKGEPSTSVRESVTLLGRLIRTCIEKNELPVPDALAL